MRKSRGSPAQGQTPKPHVAQNAGNNEWYTPYVIIKAARLTMGGIDLDPATAPKAQKVIRAVTHYTKKDDGLRHRWAGRVWLNPPYSKDRIKDFIWRLFDEQVTQWIALVNNGTETQWGQRILEECNAVCFPSGRIRFIPEEDDSDRGAPLQGQMIVGRVDDPRKFAHHFARFGVVLMGPDFTPNIGTAPAQKSRFRPSR